MAAGLVLRGCAITLTAWVVLQIATTILLGGFFLEGREITGMMLMEPVIGAGPVVLAAAALWVLAAGGGDERRRAIAGVLFVLSAISGQVVAFVDRVNADSAAVHGRP